MRIDLGSYRTANVHVYSGRPRGEAVRRELNLDTIDSDGQTVEVVVPEDVYSINASFFLGLFGESVRKAGSKEQFLKKFVFSCSKEIEKDVLDGIDRAFREESALQKRA